MTAYATPAEYMDFFGCDEALMLTQLDDPNAVEVNEALIEKALVDASDEANGYLRGRYAIPVESPPNQLKRWIFAIARYLLNRYKPPQVVVDDYERVLRQLKEVRAGRLDLGVGAETGVATPVVGAPEIFEIGGGSTFGDMGGF
jgi:phage gp36-like protein